MPATIDLRIPVSPDERDTVKRRAGKLGIANLVRTLLGLPPRKKGRPPVAKPKK